MTSCPSCVMAPRISTASRLAKLIPALAFALLALLATSATARQLSRASLAATVPFDAIRSCLTDPDDVFQFTSLPAGFEPSDAIFDDRSNQLFVVSDDGTVAAFRPDGELVATWGVQVPDWVVESSGVKLKKRKGKGRKGKVASVRADLEGCTIVPDRPDFLYLAMEFPPALLEFSLTQGRVIRAFPLASFIGTKPTTAGVEALTFIPDPAAPHGGWFAVGRQSDATIFVFDVPPIYGTRVHPLVLRGTMQPPGPREDLSALLVLPGEEQLVAVFDKPQVAVAIDLRDARFVNELLAPTTLSSAVHVDVARGPEAMTATTPYRGIEAFALARTGPDRDRLMLFLGLDVNKSKTRELYRLTCRVREP
ncbi:hypothetical protein AMAG_06643 [Allomyces macrogynus ATCC 38327]|uniref:Phytase-like domain-containing protein n=1 Tax=Allomyces macrogynus (strain ATCC 38327) TaxID=578462 RepID=A0A0L0SEH1_ALLM3|nr:hypothetical protein AMAG_06643 [Allomyces macrogynus ATCC 38327]|eukprot:KNE60881.1 hypothetical protein AMAG_06643 [Allomyces macrogynus ATCC 38327]